jgi:hypothetical protein
MPRTNRLERIPADPGTTKGQDYADHERRERFDSSMAVGMVVIGRSHGDDHAQQHNGRRQHIAGKLKACGNHRCRPRQDTDHDIERGEECAGDDAHQCDSLSRSYRVVDVRAHASIIQAVSILKSSEAAPQTL